LFAIVVAYKEYGDLSRFCVSYGVALPRVNEC
jgi:hypothetical protein